VVDEFNGVFHVNSDTTFASIRDGSSQTLIVGERSDPSFDSTWLGVITDSTYTGWRVLGWTGEPPNHPGTSLVHYHGFAQFNSDHPSAANFAFADGSVRVIAETIDQRLFRALGTKNGNEIVSDY
jgi:prepilin-type processing-associated H-X9-DG protein